MIWFRGKIAPRASLAFGHKSIFRDELVQSPLQGPLGKSEFRTREQLFH